MHGRMSEGEKMTIGEGIAIASLMLTVLIYASDACGQGQSVRSR